MRMGWTSSRMGDEFTVRPSARSPRQCAQGQARRSAFHEHVERCPSDQVMRKVLPTILPISTGVGIRGLIILPVRRAAGNPLPEWSHESARARQTAVA